MSSTEKNSELYETIKTLTGMTGVTNQRKTTLVEQGVQSIIYVLLSAQFSYQNS